MRRDAESALAVTVGIRRLAPDVARPAYHSAGAAAMDLVANEEVTVAPGEVRLVGTGLVVRVPAGYFLAVFARSSLPIRKGLIVANGVGIVDSDYCGPDDEVKVEVLNTTRADVTVLRGERIAQAVVLPVPRVEWVEMADDEGRPSRGGFGATGGL
jgi:dUTP pyrophosphatase